MNRPPKSRLYSPDLEKGSCGFGLLAQMDGKPSDRLLTIAIESLARLSHRGAIDADGKTGDGCGLLFKMPVAFMHKQAKRLNIDLDELFAVGQVFLSQDEKQATKEKETLEKTLSDLDLQCLGWREVPTNPEACGEIALVSLPRIQQVFVNAGKLTPDEFENKLLVAQHQVSNQLLSPNRPFYIASLSSRTISYKGLVMAHNLSLFYPDLKDTDIKTSICVFHQRFSTNTWPQWWLAQPFRFLAHNGEINTIKGNRNWACARVHILKSPRLPNLCDFNPFVHTDNSDSSTLDNMFEILLAGGLSFTHAMRMLIPPAWQNANLNDADLRAFYAYNAMTMEPWDGSAGVVLTDGRYVGCSMDRNGLRPARYVITKDRHIMLASEMGVYDYQAEDIASKGRLKPGEMLAVDTQTGQLLLSADIDNELKQRKPYRSWMDKNLVVFPFEEQDISSIPNRREPLSSKELVSYEKLFGVTAEEKESVIRVLAKAAQEATGSMGDDTPLPVFSQQVRSLYDNFRQMFAQVTNPSIDPLREKIVMSLKTYLGPEINPFADLADHKIIEIPSPVLSPERFQSILNSSDPAFVHHVFDLNILAESDLHTEIKSLCDSVIKKVRQDNITLVVLSDYNIARTLVPIPALLACGAVHQRLISEGLRCKTSIIIDTGSARDSHHFATLIGYGASAIHAYLSHNILHSPSQKKENFDDPVPKTFASQYRQGINKGLMKILSKMGIATIASYRGAGLFEIVGLDDEIVNACFAGTPSRLGGTNFEDIQNELLQTRWSTWNDKIPTPQGGLLKYTHDGEYHAFNPDVVKSLQTAVQSGLQEDYKVFSNHVHSRAPMVIRDLFKLQPEREAISIDQVEPIENILPRFDSAGMSLGALSPDAHETLAEAMNALGARSNSGEGGEDPARYNTDKVSKIKQVASGRFGVTPHYLTQAEVLQIKIAQGAKPGEGGQLPGDKVNSLIASLRYAKEGVTLISPPPHHDIYSIEDLAQLIFDLKEVNPTALVSVKLVAEAGVGTVAVGVAKAYADLITISGYDGGTGASPLTSIKYAGSPWEIGLTETHLALRANNLRHKIRLQTDGGLKTGLDVIKAGILGAESFGFGTAPMIAMGCKYLRICHLNNCATGVATQNEKLRALHFIGKKEMVMNYFKFVAQEVRELLASLGLEKFEEVIGQTHLLHAKQDLSAKHKRMHLQDILSQGEIPQERQHFCSLPKNAPYDKGRLATQIMDDMLPHIKDKTPARASYPIQNIDRSIGGRLCGEIARLYGSDGAKDSPLSLHFNGTAGQSFGVWNIGGVTLELEGDANDYVGKGMAGGEIILYPPKPLRHAAKDTPIIGNTCLYGATGGRLFASGQAGERFAVRNSGAVTVVEGIGDHGCEYMTGGAVIVLGKTGINFGAGMTGGFAMVLDQDHTFSDMYNHELVEIYRLNEEAMYAQSEYLKKLIATHFEKTHSIWAEEIHTNFSSYLPMFWLVKPKQIQISSLLASLRAAA